MVEETLTSTKKKKKLIVDQNCKKNHKYLLCQNSIQCMHKIWKMTRRTFIYLFTCPSRKSPSKLKRRRSIEKIRAQQLQTFLMPALYSVNIFNCNCGILLLLLLLNNIKKHYKPIVSWIFQQNKYDWTWRQQVKMWYCNNIKIIFDIPFY